MLRQPSLLSLVVQQRQARIRVIHTRPKQGPGMVRKNSKQLDEIRQNSRF
jgi:hypothetical protein